MNFTPSQQAWINAVADGDELDRWRTRSLFLLGRYCASRSLLENLTRDQAEVILRAMLRQTLKDSLKEDGYGFVLLTWLLIVVLGAAISWAVQRLLDWLYPETPLAIDRRRLADLAKLQFDWSLGK